MESHLAPVLRSVGISKPQDILSVNAGLAGWNLIVAEIAGLYVEDFGRRPIFFVSMLGMIISCSFVMGFSAGFAETGTTALGVAAVPFLFLFFGSYDIAWTTLNYTYVAELMPFSLRTKGLAIYLCVQQLGNTFNQFVNPIALQALTWRYYAVYIAVDCLYAVIIYFCFPETKKMSIEEASMIFGSLRRRMDFESVQGSVFAETVGQDAMCSSLQRERPGSLQSEGVLKERTST
ncbi:hypothetical protein COL154_007975 [Colletotrichum chrysophilum]|nr:hypothetical protein COL154_007975 [Colletotrichum chrysophilum]